MWQLDELPRIVSVTLSPDGDTIALGLFGVPDTALGVLLLDARSGKQQGGLGLDLDLNFMPRTVYPSFGSGVSQLMYTRDGALLYGLSNDTLFVWDVAAKRYLWTVDVPAVIEAPPDLPDPLPYGHATGFALSPDGRQIAAVRDALRVATAGRTRPAPLYQTSAVQTHAACRRCIFPLTAGFWPRESSACRIRARQSFTQPISGLPDRHPTRVDGCGGEIAWSGTPDLFACNNDDGAHLLNIQHPGKDVGAAGPPSDLPILKVGDALWSVGYRNSDWTDPTRPLRLMLVELGTGKRVTITLPAPAATVHGPQRTTASGLHSSLRLECAGAGIPA